MRISGNIIGTCLFLSISVICAWATFAPPSHHKITGINEIYFVSPHKCTIYTLDDETKEYKVRTMRQMKKIRLFVDQTKPEFVSWVEHPLGYTDIEVHINYLGKVRGDMESQ